MVLADTFRFNGDIINDFVGLAIVAVVCILGVLWLFRDYWLPIAVVIIMVVVGIALFDANRSADKHQRVVKAARQAAIKQAELKRAIRHDLVLEGWRPARIYRIDTVDKTVTVLLGPLQCTQVYPLLRTTWGTGQPYWWLYIRQVNDGAIFPFRAGDVAGLANACQP